MRFKIGDKVRVTRDQFEQDNGEEGIITRMSGEHTNIYVTLSDKVAYVFVPEELTLITKFE